MTQPTALAVALLIFRLGDDCFNPAAAQVGTIGPRGVRLIAQQCCRPGAGATESGALDPQLIHERDEHRAVAVLAGGAHGDQRQSVAVDELMGLRRQPTPGPAQRVVRRLDVRIRVVRRVPFLGA